MACEVLPGYVIAAAEAFAVVFARACGDVRMTELVAVVHIGRTMIVEVFARTLDAIVKALPLNLAKFRRRRVPTTLDGGRPLRRSVCPGYYNARGFERKRQQ